LSGHGHSKEAAEKKEGGHGKATTEHRGEEKHGEGEHEHHHDT